MLKERKVCIKNGKYVYERIVANTEISEIISEINLVKDKIMQRL